MWRTERPNRTMQLAKEAGGLPEENKHRKHANTEHDCMCIEK